MKHATECGGSSADRYGKCTGAKEYETWLLNGGAAQQGITFTKKVAGEAAHIGTALHYVTEECLNSEEQPEDFIEDEIDIEEKNAKGEDVVITITDQMIGDKVRPALDWFDNTLPDAEFWTEHKVQFPQNKLPGCWGTPDILFKDAEFGAGLIDWKFGNVFVPASATQFKFYLAAALHLEWFSAKTKKFVVFVAQPFEAKVNGDTMVYTRKALEEYEEELYVAFQQHKSLRALAEENPDVLQDPDYYTIGEHCKYCPIGDAGLCPKKREGIAKFYKPFKAKHAVAPARTAVKTTAKAVISEAPSIKDLYVEALRAQTWTKQVIDFVKNEFKEGRTIDGLERQVYREELTWVDKDKALNWVRRQELKNGEKIRADDYYGPRTLLPAQKIQELLTDPIPAKIAVKRPTAYQVIEKVITKAQAKVFDKVKNLLSREESQ